MITGEYKNTIDDKGRLLIPSRMRGGITGNIIIVTRGVEKCLWMFPPEEWKRITSILLDSTSLFKSKTRLLQRRIIAPAQECEIDKAGRINIPPTLRESAGLSRDAVNLGLERYMEIWDEKADEKFLNESETEFKEAAEELGEVLPL